MAWRSILECKQMRHEGQVTESKKGRREGRFADSPMPRTGGCRLECGRQAGNQRAPFPKGMPIEAGTTSRMEQESRGRKSGMAEKGLSRGGA